jgi:hypothetical protein
MSRSYWAIFAALGVAVAGSSVVGIVTYPVTPVLKTYHYEDARPGGYQPGGEACKPPALASIRDRRERESKREACAKEAEDHRVQSNDLIQQTRAADAADAQALVANQALWLVFFQTIGGFLTLIAAAAAAIYARDAAIAARESLGHEKETTDIDMRPWLQIELKPKLFKANAKHVLVSYDLEVTNIGKTPAKDVYHKSIYSNFGPEQIEDIPAFFAAEFVPHSGVNPRTILPQDKVTFSAAANIKREELRTIENSGRHWVAPLVAVRVVYAWGHGKSGQTGKSFSIFRKVAPRGEQNQLIRLLEDGNANFPVESEASRWDSVA